MLIAGGVGGGSCSSGCRPSRRSSGSPGARRRWPNGSGSRGTFTTPCCRCWRWSAAAAGPSAARRPSWVCWPGSRKRRCAPCSPRTRAGPRATGADGQLDLRALVGAVGRRPGHGVLPRDRRCCSRQDKAEALAGAAAAALDNVRRHAGPGRAGVAAGGGRGRAGASSASATRARFRAPGGWPRRRPTAAWAYSHSIVGRLRARWAGRRPSPRPLARERRSSCVWPGPDAEPEAGSPAGRPGCWSWTTTRSGASGPPGTWTRPGSRSRARRASGAQALRDRGRRQAGCGAAGPEPARPARRRGHPRAAGRRAVGSGC